MPVIGNGLDDGIVEQTTPASASSGGVESPIAPYETMYRSLVVSGKIAATTASCVVTRERVDHEIEASGDLNPIHQELGVAQGTLLLGIVSQLLAAAVPMQVENQATYYHEFESVEFLSPVLVDDVVAVRYRINPPYTDEKDRPAVKIACEMLVDVVEEPVMKCVLVIGFTRARTLSASIKLLRRLRQRQRSQQRI